MRKHKKNVNQDISNHNVKQFETQDENRKEEHKYNIMSKENENNLKNKHKENEARDKIKSVSIHF